MSKSKQTIVLDCDGMEPARTRSSSRKRPAVPSESHDKQRFKRSLAANGSGECIDLTEDDARRDEQEWQQELEDDEMHMMAIVAGGMGQEDFGDGADSEDIGGSAPSGSVVSASARERHSGSSGPDQQQQEEQWKKQWGDTGGGGQHARTHVTATADDRMTHVTNTMLTGAASNSLPQRMGEAAGEVSSPELSDEQVGR